MLKSLIKRVFAMLGVQVRRLPPTSLSIECPKPLRFGAYAIETDNLELMRSYQDYPETNAVIGRLVSLLARHGDPAMIDIGANCGDSLAIAKQAFPDIEALCIEGDKHLLSVLTLNSQQFSRVTIKNCYLGEEKTQIEVSLDKRGQNNTIVHAQGIIGEKEVISIDVLDEIALPWPGLSKLRFIKCDTEGYDVRILCGGFETLRRYLPVLLFEYNRQAMQASGEIGLRIFPKLVEAGYR